LKAKYLLPLALTLLAGCGGTISPALQQQAGPPVSFAALSANPEQYLGRVVILGGEVMTLAPLGPGTLMTVNQQELADLGNPRGAPSGGAFLVASDKWLSPGTFQPKSTVKVAGEVQGRREGMLFLKAREVIFNAAPVWEKWFYPVPRDWYPPEMEHWFTPPYFDPWRGGMVN
jgi:starvation-inducible outer membrane lipoprotein